MKSDSQDHSSFSSWCPIKPGKYNTHQCKEKPLIPGPGYQMKSRLILIASDLSFATVFSNLLAPPSAHHIGPKMLQMFNIRLLCSMLALCWFHSGTNNGENLSKMHVWTSIVSNMSCHQMSFLMTIVDHENSPKTNPKRYVFPLRVRLRF